MDATRAWPAECIAVRCGSGKHPPTQRMGVAHPAVSQAGTVEPRSVSGVRNPFANEVDSNALRVESPMYRELSLLK